MYATKWVPIHKCSMETELIPASKVESVVAESTVWEDKVNILNLRVMSAGRISGFRRVDQELIPAVVEALGIAEALGLKPPPSPDVESNASRYLRLKGLLGTEETLVLTIQSGGQVVVTKFGSLASICRGATLDDALDNL
jgi:hypothetical protein